MVFTPYWKAYRKREPAIATNFGSRPSSYSSSIFKNVFGRGQNYDVAIYIIGAKATENRRHIAGLEMPSHRVVFGRARRSAASAGSSPIREDPYANTQMV